VHLGEDSLRFTDAVLAAAPRGRVVEVGTGSGLAAAAAARTGEHVTAVDVLPRALDTARLTAGLNRVADRIDLDVADFRDWTPSGSVDVVIANLPGVPVPVDVAYPTAGDGGPDGLALIRPLWHWAARTLTDGGPGRKAGRGRLVMRFQALGDDARPAVLTELREVFGRDADITVVTDSRVPTLVRNAITAVRAAALAGHDSPLPLLARITAGTDAIGSAYHCSTLRVDLAGRGRTTHSFTGTDLRLDAVPRDAVEAWTAAESLARSRALAGAFASGLSGMPDEFWSVGGERAAAAVLTHLDDVVTALADGITPTGVAGDVLGADADDDLIAHVGTVMAVALLASRLRTGSLTTPTPMPVTATHRTPRPLAATGASVPGGGA
jgi:SAM-dependent methyltransferase